MTTATKSESLQMPDVAEEWAALKKELPWFTDRLFEPDAGGVLCRRTLADALRQLNETDTSRAGDVQARELIIATIEDFDTKRRAGKVDPVAIQQSKKIFLELLIGLTPEEAAQALDSSVPELHRHLAGKSLVRVLDELSGERADAIFETDQAAEKRRERRADKSGADPLTGPGAPEMQESAVQFSESARRRRSAAVAAAAEFRARHIHRRNRR